MNNQLNAALNSSEISLNTGRSLLNTTCTTFIFIKICFIGISLFNTSVQLADSHVPTNATFNNFAQTIGTERNLANIPMMQCASNLSKVSVETEDPLRELVLCSKNESCERNRLNALAARAANLSAAEEVVSKPGTSMKSLAGIFAGTETFVRKVEETIKKKYTALDPSDSEGVGGKSICNVLWLIFELCGKVYCKPSNVKKTTQSLNSVISNEF